MSKASLTSEKPSLARPRKKSGQPKSDTRDTGARNGRFRKGGDVVFEEIRARIASHRMPPGSKLKESELAAEFNVSRTRIREVLGALEQRGLIDRIPNRGAVVSRLELKQASDLYDVREYLEALCVRRATINAPDHTWDDLIPKIEALTGRELDDDEFDLYLAYLEVLRERMITYADSPLLAHMLDLIYDKSQVIARRVVVLPGRSAVALRLHRELLEAMSKRDADLAEKIRREILSSARAMLEKYKRFVL
jgi:DNA-binding GntR family transcriptional regulator